MDLNLKDKIVLITGGSKGLGRAIAHRFASEGCHLHLVARTQETLDEAADALRQQFSVKIGTFAIDLAQRGTAQRVAETCGDVDILVNNAGDVPPGSLEAIEEDRWRAGWDTKVFNYINLSREYFRRMRARRSGVIVNLTGTAVICLIPATSPAASATLPWRLSPDRWAQIVTRSACAWWGSIPGRAQLNASSVWHARKRRSGTAIPIAGMKRSGPSRSAARRRRTK
jgi:NAD(P)-dependent dehydrogenase (short-subunit alcohol dehydrogenase family)